MDIREGYVDHGTLYIVAGQYNGYSTSMKLGPRSSWIRRRAARYQVKQRLLSRPFPRNLHRVRR